MSIATSGQWSLPVPGHWLVTVVSDGGPVVSDGGPVVSDGGPVVSGGGPVSVTAGRSVTGQGCARLMSHESNLTRL